MIAEVTGLAEALKMANGLAKQTRYATSQALNDTALAIQRHTVDTLLPSKFTLRSKGAPWQKPGNKLGFNIKFAKKDRLESIIGSKASWLKLQEEGGTKLPAHITRKISEVPGFSQYKVAVPTKFWKDTLEIMRHDKKPSMILERKVRKRAFKQISRDGKTTGFYSKPFLVNSSKGGGIFVRTSSKRTPIRPLFFLFKSTRVKPVLNFVNNGKVIADLQFVKHFQKRLANALATAK